jgi:hypothetical protein
MLRFSATFQLEKTKATHHIEAAGHKTSGLFRAAPLNDIGANAQREPARESISRGNGASSTRMTTFSTGVTRNIFPPPAADAGRHRPTLC